MTGCTQAPTGLANKPAETLRDGAVTPTPPTSEDPALGILVAVLASAVVWPALLLFWFYVRR